MMKCRNCSENLSQVFLDLGFAPPSNSYLDKGDLQKPETTYPLKIYVCENCWLVQTEDFVAAEELFNPKYAYYSSTSVSWLRHAEDYCNYITERLKLNNNSLVIELAANDGYLLKNFVEKNIPCVGIEPTTATASIAKKKCIPIIEDFFSLKLTREIVIPKIGKADLIIGNNVYAHVPDINDFTAAVAESLKVGGTVTLEFPHLKNMMEKVQFDTVYHEHFSYLSLHAVLNIFNNHGMKIYDVEKINTHGGSLRVFGCHVDAEFKIRSNVEKLLEEEIRFGLCDVKIYSSFQEKSNKIKNDLLDFLIKKNKEGKIIAAYGAAAKGNTFLNYAGIKKDLISYVCDAAESKQGKFMPGSHIPIHHPGKLRTDVPDEILILPWNIADEVKSELSDLEMQGVKFLVAIPNLKYV